MASGVKSASEMNERTRLADGGCVLEGLAARTRVLARNIDGRLMSGTLH